MSAGARLVLLGVGAAYAIGIALVALYLVREVLALVFIAWVVAAAMRPPVATLERRLPRALAAALIYLLVIVLFAALMLLVVPPLATELVQLADELPAYLHQLQAGIGLFQDWLSQYGLTFGLGDVVTQARDVAGEQIQSLLFVPLAALRLTFAFLAVLVISFYWLLLRERTLNWLVTLLPTAAAEARARSLFDRAEDQMGAYVRGLALLSVSIGVLSLIGLLVLGVPFALALAVIAGILELLPTIGPILSAVPAVILAATKSPLLALGTAVLYLVIQQAENYLLVPKVQEKAVGLSPLATLVAVLLGATLAGVVGALLAVPIAALISLVVGDLRRGGN